MATWDDFPTVDEAPKNTLSWDAFPDVKEEPLIDISDTLSAAGSAIKGIGTTAPRAFRQLYEGLDNPWNRSAGYLESQAEMDRLNAENEAANQAAIESGDISTMSRGMRQAGQSLGFSAGAMGAGLVGSSAAGAVGRTIGAAFGPEGIVPGELIGRGVGGVAAGYGAAYRMAGAQFLDDARKEIDDKFMALLGRPPNEQEQAEAYAELKPLAEAFGHAEAGPEAIGNLAMAGAGKYILGPLLGKQAIKNLASGALKKSGALAGGVATELGGETITQVEQNRIEEQKNALLSGEAPPEQGDRTVDEYSKALGEVAPATLATMGLIGSVPTAIKAGSMLLNKPKPQVEQLPQVQEAISTAEASVQEAAAAGVPVSATAQALAEIEKGEPTAFDFAENLRQTQEEGAAADVTAKQMRAQEEYAAAQAAAERQAQYESLKANAPLATTPVGSPFSETPDATVANLEAGSGDSAILGLGDDGGTVPQEAQPEAAGQAPPQGLVSPSALIPDENAALATQAPRITELARQAAAINAGTERGLNLKFPRVAHEMDTMPLKDLSNYAKAQGMNEKESVGYARGHIAEWATKIVDKANGLFGKSIKLGFFPSKISEDGMRVVASGKGMSHKNGIEVDDSQSPLHAAWVALHEFAHQLFPTQALPKEASLAKGLHPNGLKDIKSKTKAEKLASDFANWMLAKEYPEHAASIPTVSKPLADFFESSTKPLTPTTETPTPATEGQPMSGDSGSVVDFEALEQVANQLDKKPYQPITATQERRLENLGLVKRSNKKLSLSDGGRSQLASFVASRKKSEAAATEAFDRRQEELINDIESGRPISKSDAQVYFSPDSTWLDRAIITKPEASGKPDKAAPSVAGVDTNPTASGPISTRLKAAKSREEAREILNGVKNLLALKDLAKEMGYPTTGTKKDVVNRLVAAVGSRFDAAAIRDSVKVEERVEAEETYRPESQPSKSPEKQAPSNTDGLSKQELSKSVLSDVNARPNYDKPVTNEGDILNVGDRVSMFTADGGRTILGTVDSIDSYQPEFANGQKSKTWEHDLKIKWDERSDISQSIPIQYLSKETSLDQPLSPASQKETPSSPAAKLEKEEVVPGTSAKMEDGGRSIPPVATKETSQAETSSGKVEGGKGDVFARLARDAQRKPLSTQSERQRALNELTEDVKRQIGSDPAEIQRFNELLGLPKTNKSIPRIATAFLEQADALVSEQPATMEEAFGQDMSELQVGDVVSWEDKDGKAHTGAILSRKKDVYQIADKTQETTVRLPRHELTLVEDAGKASRTKALDSIIGTPQGVEMNAVSPTDGQEALSTVHNTGDVPGVLNAFVGTSKEFLANAENEKNYPELWKIIKGGRVDEGNFAYGRAFVFTDGIGINDSDRRNAKSLAVTPAVAAVRRVLIHESLVHRGVYGLPRNLQMQILQWVRQNSTPQQLDALAKDYPQYADWATNPQQMLGLCEEYLAKTVEKLTKMPTSGPLARLMDILRDIWRWITGNTGDPTVQNLRDVVKLLKAGVEAADAKLMNGGGIKMSQLRAQGFVTPEMDAEYAKAVESGDVAKQQELVDKAAKAAGYEFTDADKDMILRSSTDWFALGSRDFSSSVARKLLKLGLLARQPAQGAGLSRMYDYRLTDEGVRVRYLLKRAKPVNPLKELKRLFGPRMSGHVRSGSLEEEVLGDSQALQRGYPEEFATISARDSVLGKLSKSATGIRQNLWEHLGDLYHRAASTTDYGNMAPKVKTFMRLTTNHSLAEELKRQQDSNAIYHLVIQKHGREYTREQFDEVGSSPDGRETVNTAEMNLKFMDAAFASMYERMQAFTPLQAMGRNMAIAFGLRRYATARKLGEAILKNIDGRDDAVVLKGFSPSGVNNLSKSDNQTGDQMERLKRIGEAIASDPSKANEVFNTLSARITGEELLAPITRAEFANLLRGGEIAAVDSGVVGRINNSQVLNPVVEAIPVEVMNMLGSKELATDALLNNPAMFQNALASAKAQNLIGEPEVTRLRDKAVSVAAGARAELASVPLASLDREMFAAVEALQHNLVAAVGDKTTVRGSSSEDALGRVKDAGGVSERVAGATAEAQEKAERKLYEKKLREEEKENARLEKERAEQEKLTESRRESLDSIIGTPQGVQMNAVSAADGQESLALVHNSGDVPGVLNAFVGTSKEFLANPQNEKDFPELFAILKNGRVDEGNFAYGRAFVFTDGIGVNASDRANAAKLGISPSVAAVRRVLIHEGLVHRGIYGLPARLQMQILQWVKQNAKPEDLDALAKTYPQYANWATNPQQMLGLAEEFLAKNVEKMTRFPTSGPLARLVEILKDIWRYVTGKDGEPTVQNIRDIVKLLKAGAKAADARLVNGGGIKMSQLRSQGFVTPEMDAEYMAAVESGDVEKQQELVDKAAKAAGFDPIPWFRGDKFTVKRDGETSTIDINSYDPTKLRDKSGIFFASTPARIAIYGDARHPTGGIRRFFVKANRLVSASEFSRRQKDLESQGLSERRDDGMLAVALAKEGFDGVQWGDNTIAVFNPSQIKSADPVTRDDSGNVIPLSQRFNPAKADIRESRISYANPLDAQLASAAERMRQMREKQGAQEVDAQSIRNEIRKAYDAAIIGQGSVQAPLQQVYDIAKAAIPTLTEKQFGEQVQALYEDGSAFLVPTDRSSDMLAAGEKWGVYDVAGLPASYIGVMPTEIKASKVSSDTEAQHRKIVQEKKVVGPQVNYGGRPMQDEKGNILDPTFQTEEGYVRHNLVAQKIVSDLIEQLPSPTDLPTELNSDSYLNAIGAERNIDLQQSLFVEAEYALRKLAEQSKDPEEAHKLIRSSKEAQAYARQLRSGAGRALGRVGWQYKDSRYSGQFVVDGIESARAEEQAEAVDGKFTEDADQQVSSINSDANQEANDAMAGDLEGALENEQLEEGKKSLSEKARGLLARIQSWIADLGAVRMALASKKGNIKASSAAERRSKYDNMTVAQLEAEESTLSKKVEDALEELADELFKTAQTKKGGKKVTKAGAKKTAEKLARPTAKEKLLKGGKMTQLQRLLDKTREGWTWAQIFTLPEAGQFRRRADMLQKVKENEAFADLTDNEKTQLVDLLDQAWYDRKAEYFGRLMQRMGAKLPFASNKSASLAVVQSVDKLLKHFNDGTFDRDAFREVLAEKFGIKPINQENLARAKQLAQEMQSPDISNPMWVKKADELIKLVSEGQKLSKARIMSDWWITSVLSGPRTLFAIATAFSNGLGRIIADGSSNVILKGDVKSMGQALKRYFELWPQAFKEMGHYIVSGDKSILENSKEQLSGFMADGLKGGNPISTAYQLLHWNKDKRPDASPWEKTQGKIMRMMGRFMTVVERILTGLDHFNAATTKYGYLPLAIAQNRAIYESARLPTEAEMNNYRNQAKAELFDGKEPQTAAEKIVLDNWARQLSDKHYSEFQDIVDGANYAGQSAAMTTNPEGFAGGAYRLILGAASRGRDAADKLARQAELIKQDPEASKYDVWLAQTSAAAAQLAAYSAQNLLGLRFVRFLSNKFNDTLTYIPIAGALLRAGEKTNRNNTKKSIIQSNQAIGFTLGWLGWMAVKAIADEPDDEKRGWSINGSWESLSPEQKSQLMSDGGKAYSITIYGKDGKKHVLSYQGWPISAILSAIGTLTDMVKYQRDKWDERDYGDRLFAAAYVASTSVADTAALSQLSEIMGKSVHSSDPIESGVKRFSRYGSNFAGGFIPRIFKDMDSWFNEGINKYDGVYENFAKEVPWYRTAIGKPRLDIFGEQVKVSRMPWSREFPRQPTDPAYKILGKLNQRDLWLSPSDPALRTVGTGKRRRHLNPEEQDRYMREVSQGYKAIVEKYGQRILAMPGQRAEDFLADKAKEVRDRAEKKAIRRTITAQ